MSFLTQLLEHYHLTMKDLEARKADGSFFGLKRPDELPEFQAVLKRIQNAIDNKEKTVIYGDYDVDGITATTILKATLDELGLNPGFFVPSRYQEGYGLCVSRVHEFHKKGYSLIICVDNGVAAFDAIQEAKDLGMEVVVIDHHDLPEREIETPYLFHQTHSHFLSYNCSACSLSYFVASSLLHRDEPYFATLAGLAVFSDVMPLVGNNLIFAKLMKQFLNQEHYHNLTALLETDFPSYDDVNFKLIPCLNAPGRVGKEMMDTIRVVSYLLPSTTEEKKNALKMKLISLNQQRRNVSASMTFHSELSSEHSYVVIQDSFSGLTGLVANKLMNEKKVPVLVFAPMENDPSLLVGSIRAPEGYSLLSFLHKNAGKFVAAGGHERACGITIKKEDYYIAATLFSTEVALQALNPVKISDNLMISPEDLCEENYKILEMFMPFGEGFAKPTFELTIPREFFRIAPSGLVAYAMLNQGNSKVTMFQGFDVLKDPDRELLTLQGQISRSVFRNKSTIEFKVTAVK